MRKTVADIKSSLTEALNHDFTDMVLREDGLTPDQWREVNKRRADYESGKTEFISEEELRDYFKNWRNALPDKKGSQDSF
jgi:hypothetical protein